MALRSGTQKSKVLSLSKLQRHKSRRLLPMWPLVSMVAVQQTGSMKSWPLMQKRTTKNTWQMPKSGCFLKSRRTMLGARLKKISMMPCNRWNMRSIPSLPQTDKLPLLRLVLVLGPIASSGKSKRRFWKSESRDLDRNIGPLSFQN